MGKTIKAWAMFIAILLIPVIAIAAHFMQKSGTGTRRTAREAPDPQTFDDSPPPKLAHLSAAAPRALAEPQTLPQLRPEAPVQQPASAPKASESSQAMAAPRKTDADREAELEAAFQSAGPAGAFEKSLHDKLHRLFDTKQVDSLDCREGHCRMELSFPDAISAEKKVTDIFMAPDFDLGVAGTISSRSLARDGTMAIRIYLYRENPSAPELGNE